MATFPKVEKYFEDLQTGFLKTDDLTPYFEKKGEYLEQILFLFTKKNDALENAVQPIRNKNYTNKIAEIDKPGEENCESINLREFCQDEETIIEVFKEMMVEKYEPPCNNLTAIQYHLAALWLFYNFMKPKEISFDTILKLDLITIQIVGVACMLIARSESYIKEWENLLRLRNSACGRPQGGLSEAVEYLWNKLEDNGENEYLQKRKVNLFVRRLKSCINEKSNYFDEYIAERIERITQTETGWKITPQGSEAVSQTAVSTILSRIRAEKNSER